MRRTLDPESLLADAVADCYGDPLRFALTMFPWGDPTTPLAGFEGPEQWQRELLEELGEEIRERKFNGTDAVAPIRIGRASGHGIGKSAMSAILILFVASTRPFSKGVVTSNTNDQLRTKTWSELAKWKSMCLCGHWFTLNSGRGSLSMLHTQYPETWRVDAQTSREENSESFAGLHAATSTPWYLFDEASAIPDAIWEVANGGLTDGESIHFAFGNPTRNSGGFRECFGAQAHRWNTAQIDSRTVSITNKTLLKQWEDDYGEDSDFFRVRVRGVFPKAGDTQLIPSDVVYEARHRAAVYISTDPLICGIDVARGGGDDSYIQFRRGLDARSEKTYTVPAEKSRDSMKLLSIITMILNRHKPDVTFLDETGLGGPIVNRLNQLGYHVIGVQFGGGADESSHYANKVAEMWWRMREWLMRGGAIPNSNKLESNLTHREYSHDRKDRLILESKDDLKKRGLDSPDWGDALALTFAQHVPPRSMERGELDYDEYRREGSLAVQYNPMEQLDTGSDPFEDL